MYKCKYCKCSEQKITCKDCRDKEIKNFLQRASEEYKKMGLAQYSVQFCYFEEDLGDICLETKKIRFSYELLELPPHLQNITIFHEAAHAIRGNDNALDYHDSKFWSILDQLYPNHKKLREEERSLFLRDIRKQKKMKFLLAHYRGKKMDVFDYSIEKALICAWNLFTNGKKLPEFYRYGNMIALEECWADIGEYV